MLHQSAQGFTFLHLSNSQFQVRHCIGALRQPRILVVDSHSTFITKHPQNEEEDRRGPQIVEKLLGTVLHCEFLVVVDTAARHVTQNATSADVHIVL